jgi:hypothetical protein
VALTAYGVSVAAPPGWDVRARRAVAAAPETAHVVLHAATFPLPTERADYGDGAVQLMGPDDVFVALVEFAPDAARTALFAARGWPPPLAGGDFSRAALQHPLPGQAGTQRWFTVAGRPWCLYAVVGAWERRTGLAARANAFVRGVAVAPVAAPA